MCQRRVRKLRGGSGRLLHAERRQFGVFDSRIDARLVEMQIEVTLAMPQQKHGYRFPNG